MTEQTLTGQSIIITPVNEETVSVTVENEEGGGSQTSPAGGGFIVPGTRLSLSSGTSVHTSDVLGATALHLVPHVHGFLSLWDGTAWNQCSVGSGLSLDMSSAAAYMVYDCFVWDDEGALTLSVGPAWTDATTRSLALSRQDGVMVNGAAITGGPDASRGLYVGTVATNGSGTLDMMVNPTPAVGGCANMLSVWNMYNRIAVSARNLDSGSEYSYNGAGTRAKRGSNDNSITLVIGIDDDAIQCYSGARCDTTNGTSARIGIGIDSTAVISPLCNTAEFTNDTDGGGSQDLTGLSVLFGHIGQGRHTLYALERGPSNGGTILWRDNVDASDRHFQGMNLRARM